MSAPAKTSAKTSAVKIPAVQGAKTPAKSPAVQTPGKTSAKVPAAKAGLKPESDDLDLKIPDEIELATPLGPALELIAPDPDTKSVTKGGRGPITKKRKRPAASGNSGSSSSSSSSGRAAASGGKRREKAPPVALIIGIPVLLLGVGVVFLLGGGKPAPTAAPAPPAPKREPAVVFIPKGLNDPPPSTPATATPAATPADGPPAAPPKPGSGRTPEEREAQKAAEEEIAAQKKLIEERTKRLGGEPTGAAPTPETAPETPKSE